MSVTYRDATPADAAALRELFADSFVATFGHLYRPADLQLWWLAADLGRAAAHDAGGTRGPRRRSARGRVRGPAGRDGAGRSRALSGDGEGPTRWG